MPETRPTVLDTILAHKRGEIIARQSTASLGDLKAQSADQPKPHDFVDALRSPHHDIGLIAEVKKASPSAGIIRADFDPVQIAQTYAAHGADCLSVLTDERFFQGHDNYLRAIRAAVSLPLLRKDFVIDEYQIWEARALGADAVLLIVAALSPVQVADYQAIAQSLGMAALVEVHTEEEMETALRVNASLIGINSRDLKTFHTDLNTVARLAQMVPEHVILVAESGIKTPSDVAQVQSAGADAILVGETLMRAPEIGTAIDQLLGAVSTDG